MYPFDLKKFFIDDCCDILTEEREGWVKEYQSHVGVNIFSQSVEGVWWLPIAV